MNFLSNKEQKLNEIIFATRNKNYGAYAIRVSYNNSVVKALTIISSLILLATGCMYFFNGRVDGIKKMIDLPDNTMMKIVEVKILPDKPKEQEKQKTNPPAGQKNIALGTHVTDSLTENKNEKPTTNVIPVSNNTNTTEVSNPNTSTLTGGSGTTTTLPAKKNEAFAWVSDMPEFEGGMNALLRFVGRNIVYPPLAREADVQGTVYMSFVVDESGQVVDVKVERGIGFGCDEESVRVVSKIPKFKKPGRNDGQPVKVRFNIPIKFVQAK